MIKNHRIWLAVPPEEKDEAIKAHPRLNNGQNAIVWDSEQHLWYANPGVELNKFERWMPQPQNLSMSSDDPVSEFAQVLENAGLVLKGLPVMDGATHRVPTKADKNGVKSGVYKGYLDGRPAGWYRDYRSSEAKATNWTFSGGADADPRTKLHLRAQAQQNREDSARALELQYNTQAGYATRYVNSLPQATDSEYLSRKGVLAAPGVRITPKQDLVVPFSNAKGQIRSYQRIPPSGGKDARILKNSEKTGNWFTFGTPENGKPVLFAEGYSTAASIHEATGLPILMTVDAGNMIAVAENARAIWPASQFIFCADNDHHLKNSLTGEPENKGILSATRAAELTNGDVIAPAFTPAELELNLTDFNDMILSRGKDPARHLINVQLLAMGVETPFNTDSQTRNAFVEGGLVFTPVQETAMDNQESPELAQTSGNDTSRQNTVNDLAETTAVEKPLPTPSSPAAPPLTPEAPASTLKSAPEAVTPANNGPVEHASVDLELYLNKEIPAGNIVKAAEADSSYWDGMLAAMEKHGQARLAAGETLDISTYATTFFQDLVKEAVATADQQHAAASNPSPEVASVASTSPAAPDTAAPEQLSAVGTSVMPHDTTAAGDKNVDLQSTEQHINFDEENTGPAPDIDFDSLPATKPDQSHDSDIKEQTPEAPEEKPTPPLKPESELDSETNAEPDGIVYGPGRPDPAHAPNKEDIDQILKDLKWEKQSDNTVLYQVDGNDAFRDSGNRLEMCDGASRDDRNVLAALAVASKFYGGVIELTGSEAFKAKAMQLIVDYDLDIRMKLPDQRAQLEELHKQMGKNADAVVTHMPTPDLNRQTTTEPVPAAAGEPGPSSNMSPQSPPPIVPRAQSQPEPPINSNIQPPTPSKMVGGNEANGVKGISDVGKEPAPAALSPGQSITAVMVKHGEAVYEKGENRGGSYFVELKNRSGSHVYWGRDLKELAQKHATGDVVTLTLVSRDAWKKQGEDNERIKNNWSLVAASPGMAVPHTQPELGQQLHSFPVDTFSKITRQIQQAWPEHTSELKLPPRLEDRHFYLREDRHPVLSPQSNANIQAPAKGEPLVLTPVMAAMDNKSQQVDLLLVSTAGEHLQGVVRLNDTLYPALATPSADNQQLVINAVTDKGLRYAGYGQAINFEPDGTTRTEPQLMKFQLKGQEEDAPVNARLYTPERQDDALFQQLGFEQSWKQWDDSRKQEGRQELNHHQDHSHAPGR